MQAPAEHAERREIHLQPAAPVSVVILTHNEEPNIAACLRSCAWADDIHVVDSGSTDRTCEIAQEMGARVHFHPFRSFGDQRNWAIDNIAHKYEWVFHLDADEHFTAELVREIAELLARHPLEAGFYVPHKLIFMGRWIKRAEGYPVYQMRFFHRQRMRFRDYGHGQREDTDGTVGWLKNPYLHYNFSKGISEWVEKHNRYSTREADAIGAGEESGPISVRPRLFGNVVQRRRFLNVKMGPQMPGRWLARFIWGYVCKLGFLDGKAGLHYCLLMSFYDLLIALKLQDKVGRGVAEEKAPSWPEPVEAGGATKQGSTSDKLVAARREPSTWSVGDNMKRVLWMFVQASVFRFSFHNWYGWRRFLLRRFGAKVGRGVCIRPTVRIEIPWHLEVGEDSIIGDFAVLYCLGQVRVGRNTVVSQYSYLCAGTHDYTSRRFPLLRRPIAIGNEVWIAADSFVGPGVTIGDRCVIGARSTVTKDVPQDEVWAGSPARFVKARTLLD